VTFAASLQAHDDVGQQAGLVVDLFQEGEQRARVTQLKMTRLLAGAADAPVSEWKQQH
jgi:hypothetical protein